MSLCYVRLDCFETFIINKFGLDVQRSGELKVEALRKSDLLLCTIAQQESCGGEVAAFHKEK